MMKSLSTFLILFSLLLIVSTNEARNTPGEYWRSVMKDETMPKSIQDILPDQNVNKENKDQFIRNFDLKPNLIIYHSHVLYNEKNHHLVSSSSSSSASSDELN